MSKFFTQSVVDKLQQQKFTDPLIIKYGGNAMIDQALQHSFAQDVAFLKRIGLKPVIVHGGGAYIKSMLQKLGKKEYFFHGLRITDSDTMSVVQMVLAGLINKNIVSLINFYGGRAIGLTGQDAHIIRAKKLQLNESNAPDLGHVGVISSIDKSFLNTFIDDDIIPVIAPVGVDQQGQALNINADTVASGLALALTAKRLLLLSNIPGVMSDTGEQLRHLSFNQINSLIQAGTLKEGMLPKIEGALNAAKHGCTALIIDGRIAHVLITALSSPHGTVGTVIEPKER